MATGAIAPGVAHLVILHIVIFFPRFLGVASPALGVKCQPQAHTYDVHVLLSQRKRARAAKSAQEEINKAHVARRAPPGWLDPFSLDGCVA